ncbi:MAG TPA: hypothetical protein VHF05_02565, partial [Candidatus Paceibacterota bacterium]|nr:hypothetical protein [Candidatus Paceibacterota bacterium]
MHPFALLDLGQVTAYLLIVAISSAVCGIICYRLGRERDAGRALHISAIDLSHTYCLNCSKTESSTCVMFLTDRTTGVSKLYHYPNCSASSLPEKGINFRIEHLHS